MLAPAASSSETMFVLQYLILIPKTTPPHTHIPWHYITTFCRSTLAPASSSSETTSFLLSQAANISAEYPCCVKRDMCSETLMNGSSHTRLSLHVTECDSFVVKIASSMLSTKAPLQDPLSLLNTPQ